MVKQRITWRLALSEVSGLPAFTQSVFLRAHVIGAGGKATQESPRAEVTGEERDVAHFPSHCDIALSASCDAKSKKKLHLELLAFPQKDEKRGGKTEKGGKAAKEKKLGSFVWPVSEIGVTDGAEGRKLVEFEVDPSIFGGKKKSGKASKSFVSLQVKYKISTADAEGEATEATMTMADDSVSHDYSEDTVAAAAASSKSTKSSLSRKRSSTTNMSNTKPERNSVSSRGLAAVQIEQLKAQVSDLERDKARLEKRNERLSTKLEESNVVSAATTTPATASADEESEKIGALKEQIVSLQKEVKDLKKAKRRSDKASPAATAAVKAPDDISSINAEREKLTIAEARVVELEAALASRQSDADDKDFDATQPRVVELEAAIAKLRSQHDKQIEELSAVKLSLKQREADLQKASAQAKTATESLAKETQQSGETSNDRIAALEDQLKKERSLGKQAGKAFERVAELESTLEQRDSELASAKTEAEAATAKLLQDTSSMSESFAVLKADLEKERGLRKKSAKETAKSSERVSELEAELAEVRSQAESASVSTASSGKETQRIAEAHLAQIAALEAKLKHEHSQRKKATASLEQSRTRVEELESDKTVLEQKVAQTEQDLTAAQDAARLAEKAAQASQETSAAENERMIETLREELEAERQRREKVEERAVQAAKESVAGSSSSKKLSVKLEKEVQTREAAEQALAAKEDQFRTLADQLSNSKLALKKLEADFDEAQSRSVAAETRAIDLQASLTGAGAELAKLREQLAETKGKHEKERKSRKKLEGALAEIKSQKLELERSVAALEQKRDELVETSKRQSEQSVSSDALGSEIVGLKQKLEESTIQTAKLEDAVSEAHEQAAELQTQLDESERLVASLKAEISRKQSDVEGTDSKIADVRADAEKFERALAQASLVQEFVVDGILSLSHLEPNPKRSGAGWVERLLMVAKSYHVEEDVSNAVFTGVLSASTAGKKSMSAVAAFQFVVERASRDEEQLLFWLAFLLHGVISACEDNQPSHSITKRLKPAAIAAAQRAFALLVLCLCEKIENGLAGVLLKGAAKPSLKPALPRARPLADVAAILVDFALAAQRVSLSAAVAELIIARVLSFADAQLLEAFMDRSEGGLASAGTGFALKMALSQEFDSAFSAQKLKPSPDVLAELEDDESAGDSPKGSAAAAVKEAVRTVLAAVGTFNAVGGVLPRARELANFLVMDKSLAADDEAAREIFPLLTSAQMAHVAKHFVADDMCPDSVEPATLAALAKRAESDGSPLVPDSVGPDVVDVAADILLSLR